MQSLSRFFLGYMQKMQKTDEEDTQDRLVPFKAALSGLNLCCSNLYKIVLDFVVASLHDRFKKAMVCAV